MKASLIGLIMSILALAAIAPASLDAQTSAPPAQAAPLYSTAQLDQLLAPVALHPDQLLGQILMASTYPLEVVEAARWVEDPTNARLKGDQLAAALQDKDWDPSVKSLAPFPQILRMMDDRLDWMQKLGDAFHAQQNEVMDSVQRLRRQAEEAGTLQSSPQQTVTTQDQTITVEPANPNVVYVPVYDPTVVYGAWPYPDYPPCYFPPPGFVFGPPVWPGFWWGPVIRFYRIEGHHRPIVGDTWQHDPYHRRGVAYRDPGTVTQFGRSVSAPPDAHAYRGYESDSGIAPLYELRRPSSTGGAGSQGTLPNRLPTIQRPQGTMFNGYGHGPDSRAQSARGHANQQMIVPRGPSPSYSTPRSSGGVSRGGTPSGGGMLRR